MRMFYAINFGNNVKSALAKNLVEIQKHTLKGNFTDKENFHVTLVFVGECDPESLDGLKEAAFETAEKLRARSLKSIGATIEGLGTFSRPGDLLLWAGAKTEPENILGEISEILLEKLAGAKIRPQGQNNKFHPHVTLARKVEFAEKSSDIIQQISFTPVYATINSITLMESAQETAYRNERAYTKIVYRPICEAKF